MRSRSLVDMIADVRRKARMEGSAQVTDDEITEILNQQLTEVWEALVQGQGHPFYRSSQPYSIVAGTSLYALPSDFMEVQQVEATINGTIGCLRPFMPNEHAWLRNGQSWCNVPIMYAAQAENLEIQPATLSFSATLYYTPCCPRLAGADAFNGFNGYEMGAIYGTVAELLDEEETDSTPWERRKARVFERIATAATRRDAANPWRVQDVVGNAFDDLDGTWDGR